MGQGHVIDQLLPFQILFVELEDRINNRAHNQMQRLGLRNVLLRNVCQDRIRGNLNVFEEYDVARLSSITIEVGRSSKR